MKSTSVYAAAAVLCAVAAVGQGAIDADAVTVLPGFNGPLPSK